MRVISGKSFGCAVIGFLSASIFVWSAMGAEIASAPGLTGHGARDVSNLESSPTGTGQIANRMRKADGTVDDVAAPVGDFTSPLLKPEAAEVLRKRGEFSLSGLAIPDPHNQCSPEPPPFRLSFQLEMQLLQDEVTLPAGAPKPATNTYGQGDLDPDTNTKGLQVEVTVDDPSVSPCHGRDSSPIHAR
jgi:hypothetical protein